ncbi:LLM class flavin-dependent oxidoreductase [Ammoniphilus sp. CFH 90114]|uniref:LLM class flavin-dependent oxidoreductase n=1 Tax=Ammoniphilus sp. CFH 90114 TaxID=2493665 RepID=UPI00100E0C60|nr:LLM class flavin-dependent oxidoreductase [Ammoniphilus sp. CFH 90114]RXT08040.1 LLM class flavin-dependent oxidoreductase [Ammoniphilus sp. CFH 90114]
MKFGLYSEMQLHPGKTDQQLYDEVLKQIIHADQVGFDVYSLIDHHHFSRFSVSANPLAVYTAAAQLAKNIRFRTALHILPQQNPLRLAGEIAVADILTQGRIEVGVGRGHAWVFPNNGIVPIEEAKPRFEEALQILEMALTEERVTYYGQYYTAEDVQITPRPVQQKMQFTTGGTSNHTYQQAGEKGWGIFVPPLLPLESLREQFDIYLRACDKAGNEPNIIWLHAVYMDECEDNIRRESEQHFHNFLAGNASPAFTGLPDKERMMNAGYQFYAKGILQSLADMSYEQITTGDVVWAGTPEQICEKIDYCVRNIEGLAEIDFLTNYGGMDHWKVIKQQEIISKKIMPQFKTKSKVATY